MGHWRSRKAYEHKCDYPKFAVPSDTEVGDVWKCSCNKEWVVTKVTFHRVPPSSDPREHNYYTADFALYNSGGGIYKD